MKRFTANFASQQECRDLLLSNIPQLSISFPVMFNPKNISESLTRDRIAVETSTKHTIVLKPSFQNRRNRSEYLKNSFPAGFHVKNKLTERLGGSIRNDNNSQPFVKPYGSFTEWTKGQPIETADSVSIDLTDPYADVAGPYLSEMLLNRTMVQKPLPDDANQFSTMIAKEIPLHNRSELKRKPKQRNSPIKQQVFNAPSSLPPLNPALAQSKANNNLLPVNPSEYEQWLSMQRSGVGEKAWLVKGNAEGYNYSAYDFGGEKSPHLSISTTVGGHDDSPMYSPTQSEGIPPLQIQTSRQQAFLQSQLHNTSSYSTLLMDLPAPLPPRILLEVHTVNQMVRTDKLSDNKHIMRSIDSQVSLAELKGLITEDIIRGLETAFRLHGSSSADQQRREAADYTKVDLNFQCFVPLVGSWRAVGSETDWILAKQNCRNEQNTIKLMYALEKNSEFLLLKEIQQSYQRQRLEAQRRETPQISLRALTESMEQNLKQKKKYVYSDSAPSSAAPSHQPSRQQSAAAAFAPRPSNCLPVAHSIVASSRSQGSLSRGGSQSIHQLLDSLNKTDPFREEHRQGASAGGGLVNASASMASNFTNSGSAAATPSAAGGAVLSGGSRSFFYPKRSDTLDKMYEELESSMPRQQSFADNLEQRLFKTKW